MIIYLPVYSTAAVTSCTSSCQVIFFCLMAIYSAHTGVSLKCNVFTLILNKKLNQ